VGFFIQAREGGSNMRIKGPAFSVAENEVWKTLFERQIDRLMEHACDEFIRGWEQLELPADRIPHLEHLNKRIKPQTGWEVVRTKVRYSDAVQWYQAFAQKKFMVTDYIRTMEELDFTPEPDMFHDIFGHLPFMTLPEYTELQELFAPAFHRADDNHKEDIKRLAWFSTEFGLMEQNGALKIFGAGLISSKGEMENVLTDGVQLEPFTIENVLEHDKAIWSYNETLFVVESVEGLKRQLSEYFDSF
jgi:phenylalanine-4-hydroxylase